MATTFILEYNGQPVAEVEAGYDTPVFTGNCRFYDQAFGDRVMAASEFDDWASALAEQENLADAAYDTAYQQERDRRGISEDDLRSLRAQWSLVNKKGERHKAELLHFEAGGYINWRPGDTVKY